MLKRKLTKYLLPSVNQLNDFVSSFFIPLFLFCGKVILWNMYILCVQATWHFIYKIINQSICLVFGFSNELFIAGRFIVYGLNLIGKLKQIWHFLHTSRFSERKWTFSQTNSLHRPQELVCIIIHHLKVENTHNHKRPHELLLCFDHCEII